MRARISGVFLALALVAWGCSEPPLPEDLCFRDRDWDGFGDPEGLEYWGAADCLTGQDDGAAYVYNGLDCDDFESGVHPYAEEICGDGVDQDCDGQDMPCGEQGEGWSMSLSQAQASFAGQAGDRLGSSVAGAGDVDGDGHADLLLGAPHGEYGSSGAGAAILVYGPVSGASSAAAAGWALGGRASGDLAGSVLSSAGDVDADGFDDLLVGAPNQDAGGEQAGAAYLVRGPVTADGLLKEADAVLSGLAEGDLAGWSLSSGDTDGDGLSDLWIGAPEWEEYQGAVFLLRGPVSAGASLDDAQVRLTGDEAYNHAGECIVATEDVSGDGLADLLVGASGTDQSVYLVHGPYSGESGLAESEARLLAEDSGDGVGRTVAAGDLNGDGHPDVVVGAADCDHEGGVDAGRAYLVYGPITGEVGLSQSDAVVEGDEPYSYVGDSIASGGDADGDGFDELLVGAWGESEVGPAAGKAALWYGSAGDPLAGVVSFSQAGGALLGEQAYDHAGGSLAWVGDSDGDGLDDLLVGAALSDAGGASSGKAWLVQGFTRD